MSVASISCSSRQLLIEVSACSLAYDRNVKGPLYARHGIPVYWVLDLNERQLLLHEAPGSEGYRRIEVLPLQGTVSLPGLDGLHTGPVSATVLTPASESAR